MQEGVARLLLVALLLLVAPAARGQTVTAQDVEALLERLDGWWKVDDSCDGCDEVHVSDGMRAIAALGERAVPALLRLARSAALDLPVRDGALRTLHLIERAAGTASARAPLLELAGSLESPRWRRYALHFLERAPWPSDLPRLLELLRRAGPDDLRGLLGALRRRSLEGRPVHPPLPPALTGLVVEPAPGDRDALDALLRSPRVRLDEGARAVLEGLRAEGDWTGSHELGDLLRGLTDGEHGGPDLEYALEDGVVLLLTPEAAARRWLSWWDARPAGPIRTDDPYALRSASGARFEALLEACPAAATARHVTEGTTALHDAASAGSLHAAALLLWRGADPRAVDGYGHTPLHFAAQAGAVSVVALLLGHGADPRATDATGATPLHRACAGGPLLPGAPEAARLAASELLLRAGAAPAPLDREGMAPLDLAAEADHLALVSRLEQAGAPVGLHAAATLGRRDRVTLLLAADPAAAQAPRHDGRRPLELAAGRGRIEVVDLLLLAGAVVDACGPRAPTALQAAASNGHVEVVRRLLRAGAAPDGAAGDSSSPLQLAALEGHPAVAEALLDAGAWPSHFAAGQHRPPLHWASAMNHLEVLRLLLARGADPDQVDSTGTTPLFWARDDDDERGALLRAAGATRCLFDRLPR